MACVGAFYEKMGRMLGSSFPDTINNLLKALKSAEVCVRLKNLSTIFNSILHQCTDLQNILLTVKSVIYFAFSLV